MKYVSKKVIKGRAYYYLQYKTYSKNLGSHLPEDLKLRLLDFFGDVMGEESNKIAAKMRHDFPFGDIQLLEWHHHRFIALGHDLWKGTLDQFYDEFIRLFTYHSNRSEGSKTSKKEIDIFSSKNIRDPKTKTEREIFNSFLAFNHAISNEMRWNLKHIRHIHGLLLDSIDPLIAGKWKNENNTVGYQATTDHKDVPKAMKGLMAWLKQEFKKGTYPPKLALQFYVRFEHIHPFLDGNGRTGRILLNAILHKFNYPPVVFFSENHQSHSAAIQKAIEGQWGKLYKHFLEQEEKTNKAIIAKLL